MCDAISVFYNNSCVFIMSVNIVYICTWLLSVYVERMSKHNYVSSSYKSFMSLTHQGCDVHALLVPPGKKTAD